MDYIKVIKMTFLECPYKGRIEPLPCDRCRVRHCEVEDLIEVLGVI